MPTLSRNFLPFPTLSKNALLLCIGFLDRQGVGNMLCVSRTYVAITTGS